MSRARASVRALLLLVGALSAAALLSRLGHALPLPEAIGRGQIDAWLRETGAVRASFGLTRALGLGLAAYTALLALVALVATVSGAAGAARLAMRIALPSLRPLLGPIAAPIAAITLTVASAGPAIAQGRDQPPPVMQIVASPDSNPPVMRLVPVPAPSAPPTPTPPAAATYTVVAGDSFWSIAEDALRADGRAASDHDVISYWHALVDLNRERLRVAGEPDLIFPGQVFELPPIS